MNPQDYFNMFSQAAGLQAQPSAAQAGQQQPLAFLGQRQQQGQPQQGQQPNGLSALGQQGGNAYSQLGGAVGGGLKNLLANYGANGNSNTLADAVGFQPFGGGGWGSGA